MTTRYDELVRKLIDEFDFDDRLTARAIVDAIAARIAALKLQDEPAEWDAYDETPAVGAEATAHKTSEASPNELYREGENDNDGLSQDDLLRSKDTPGRPMPVEALSQPAPVERAEGPTLGDWLGKYGVCFTIGKREDAVRELYTIAGKLDAARGKR